MKHVFRFFAEAKGPFQWEFDDSEFSHLKKVLRLGPGDSIEITDLQGRLDRGPIEKIDKPEIILASSSTSETLEKTSPGIHLAIANLAPQEMDKLIGDLGEFDLESIHIFSQAGRPKARPEDKATQRWLRTLKSAKKQSKQVWMPELIIHSSLEKMLEAKAWPIHWLWADELARDAALLTDKYLEQRFRNQKSSGIILGSEMGFTSEERDFLEKHKVDPFSLGSTVLRARTAAILVAGLVTIARQRFQLGSN